MQRHVYKPRRRRGGRVKVARLWRGRYRLDGDRKPTDVALHTADKRVALQKLDELVKEAEYERAGIALPKRLVDAASKPLADHLADFIADLQAKGRAARYWRAVKLRVSKLIRECDWHQPRDVSVDSFVSWRAIQHDKAPKTLNDYLDAARGLLAWMKANGRLVTNVLDLPGLKVTTAGKETRKRRALTDDEMRRLLEVAGRRRVVYLAAAHTGLRRSELRNLLWDDVHLESPKPFVDVPASTAKNGKRAFLPLTDELADALRKLKPDGVSPSRRVFHRLVPRMDTFKRDLGKVGIPFEDRQGRRADFHALRHTCATNLHRGKVGARIAMSFMRHSDMKLTATTYTDAGALPVMEAADHLPRFLTPESVETAATGTDGDVSTDTQIDTRTTVPTRDSESLRVHPAELIQDAGSRKNTVNKGVFVHSHAMPEVGLEPTRPARAKGF